MGEASDLRPGRVAEAHATGRRTARRDRLLERAQCGALCTGGAVQAASHQAHTQPIQSTLVQLRVPERRAQQALH